MQADLSILDNRLAVGGGLDVLFGLFFLLFLLSCYSGVSLFSLAEIKCQPLAALA